MSKNNKKRRVARALIFPFSAEEYREFIGSVPARAKFRYGSFTPAPLMGSSSSEPREFFEARWWDRSKE